MNLEEKFRVVKQREEAAAAKRRKIATLIADRDQKATTRAKIMLADAAITSGFAAEVVGLLPIGDREFVLATLRLPFSPSSSDGQLPSVPVINNQPSRSLSSLFAAREGGTKTE